MTLQELKQREISLLNTGRNRYIEYGKALAEIRQLAENFAGPKLSEDVLVSSVAELYIEKEKKLYDLTKNEDHLLRIKAASELYKKSFMSFDKLYDYLSKYKRTMQFEEAKDILRDTPFYKDIDPKTLIDVLQFIELHEKEK